MRNGETLKAVLPGRALLPQHNAPDVPPPAPPLIGVLWGRRWTFVATVLACLLLAAAYLAVATRVYRAGATIYVQKNAPRVFSDGGAGDGPSDTYLQSQSDIIQSTPVVLRALESVNYGKLRTFAGVTGNPVTWMRRSALKVDVVKRSDVMTVSVDSPYPEEAALLADAVVKAYVAEQSKRAREVASEMVRVLRQEKEQLQQQRQEAVAGMLAAEKEGGGLTFRDGKGNIVLGRLDSLAHSLSEAELLTMDLKAQQQAIVAALDTPEATRDFVVGLQFKGRDLGDREYDELRSQLVQATTSLAAASRVQGRNHTRVRSLQGQIDSLQKQIAQKEEAIADAQLAEVTSRLEAAEKKEAELRAAVEAQRGKAQDLTPAAARFARLESDVRDIDRRRDLIDNRIAELNVNSADAGPFNVRVLQPAMAPEKAVKPNKSLTLAAALLLGCVLGLGLVTLREWQDARVRTPEEVSPLLGVPLVGLVPRINRRLSAVDRGQVLRLDSRSPVAESFRSIHTTLRLGDARAAKTILVASPARRDGKSTTAANLAIAFAQAGERTLLLDCDLREPVQHLIFDAGGAAGVSTVMPGETRLRDSIMPTAVPDLYLLPCGPVPRNPSEMLASDRFKYLLKSLCEAFDRVIIDSPALEEFADGRIVASAADVTVLVLRMNQSMRRSGAMALAGLGEVGANVLGAVANDVPPVNAFRLEGTPWLYAQGREHRGIAGEAAGDAAWALSKNGDHPAVAAKFSADAITVKEPEWPPGNGKALPAER